MTQIPSLGGLPPASGDQRDMASAMNDLNIACCTLGY